jgi:hypothetical protein
LLTLLGIYAFKDYGFLIFLALPIFMGYVSVRIYQAKGSIPTFRSAFGLALWTLLAYSLGLLAFAIEGAICILMAAPPALLLATLGAWLAHRVKPRNAAFTMGIPLLMLPGAILTDANLRAGEKVHAVESAVIIQSPASTVWRIVIAFPEIPPPTEALFRLGVAYPTHATIEGRGVGSLRKCHFSTGDFVEPITRWEEDRLLECRVGSRAAVESHEEAGEHR